MRTEGIRRTSSDTVLMLHLALCVPDARADGCALSLAAASALVQNSQRLLSLSKDNALFNVLQEGLPRSFVVSQRDSRKVRVCAGPPPRADALSHRC